MDRLREKYMNKTFRIRFGFSCSVNRKPVLSHVEGSKTCPELGRTIENLKWLGLLAGGGSAPPHAFVQGLRDLGYIANFETCVSWG
jgi:hypothetical protein